jgi:two-component system, cell cycle sensor histidine kinase and response regulator CckA
VTPGPHVVLAVTDTGTGMDATTRAHLFEPFFTTKPEGQGTGLGLATVYGIARQSGGFVTVDSTPGAGAQFRVYLPQVASPATGPAGSGHEAPPRGTGTILLAEDEPAVRAFTRRALENLGYRVLEAPSGADALEVAAGHDGPIDLLLTDAVMPGIQGAETARRLQAARPGTRCMFMSGFLDRTPGQSQLLGNQTLLPKPFSTGELATAVQGVLARPVSRVE